MTASVVEELRARIRERHDALQHMGWLHLDTPADPTWWAAHTRDPQCTWMTSHGDRSRGAVGIRDGAEALVLLNALAAIDSRSFLHEVQRVWKQPATVHATPSALSRRVIGFSFSLDPVEALSLVREQVQGTQSSTEGFLDTYARLQDARSTSGLQFHEYWPRSIPLRINISLRSRGDDDDLRVLRQIEQWALAQRRDLPPAISDLRARATWSSRFEIVEVRVEERGSTSANAAAVLMVLANLVRLGVRVPRLPVVAHGPITSPQESASVLASLQVLLPPYRVPQPSLSVENVHMTDTPVQFVQAVLSSVQVSQYVSTVDVHTPMSSYDYDCDDDALADDNVTIPLWKWIAYALFSRHADHHVKHVTLHVEHMDARLLHTCERVLQATNPLAAVFNTSFKNDSWIVSSRFHVEEYEEAVRDDEATLFQTPTPLRVRVIDKAVHDGVVWWRVLLPGCGETWVVDADKTAVVPGEERPISDDDCCIPARTPMRLSFVGLSERNMETVLALVRLVAQDVASIEMEGEAIGDGEDPIDMTDWIVEALRVCPHIERLSVPDNAETQRLGFLVAAAEAGYCRLRNLSLSAQLLCSDGSDIIHFLNTLSDVSHPLTTHLQELVFCVSIPDAPTNDFDAAWRRMLQRNRSLHTIYLRLVAPETVEKIDDGVTIRTGPLSAASKIAFLSDLQTSSIAATARRRLDTAVTSIIFEFAAEHRVREIEIDFESTGDTDDD